MASELELKYGCNPNQKPSRIYMKDGSELPVKVLSGKPGYINFLDALNSWQLVRELKEATGLIRAASYKRRIDTQLKSDRETALEATQGLLADVLARKHPELYDQVVRAISAERREETP